MSRLALIVLVFALTAAGCRRDVEPAEGPAHLDTGAANDLAAEVPVVEDAGDGESQAQARRVAEQFTDLDFQGARLSSDHPLRAEFEALLVETEGGSETIWVVDDFSVTDVVPADDGYRVNVVYPRAVLVAGDFEPIETQEALTATLVVRNGRVVDEGGIAHVGRAALVEHVRRIASDEDAQTLESRLAETLGASAGS